MSDCPEGQQKVSIARDGHFFSGLTKEVCRPVCKYTDSRDWNGYCNEPGPLSVAIMKLVFCLVLAFIVAGLIVWLGSSSSSSSSSLPQFSRTKTY